MADEATAVPKGLIRVEAPDTLQGYCYVKPGSHQHKQYASADVSAPEPATPVVAVSSKKAKD